MKVRIAAMVLDTERLTLYKADDGEEIVLNQGDPRIRQILKQHEPTIMAGQIAEVDLGSVENEAPNNIYGDFEKQTEGRIKFFRVIRRAVQHIFGTTEDVLLQP